MKTILFAAVLIPAAFSLVGLSGCAMEVKTEEEHLEILRKKLQARYFKDDGTPTYHAYFQVIGSDGWPTGEYVLLESFDVEILLSFDGKPEYFLVISKPFYIGYTPGIIIGNKYYLLGVNDKRNSNNPFEEEGIEKGNRYYIYNSMATDRGLAFIKDGDFTDLYDGHIYSDREIEKSLQFSRSKDGIRFIKNYSDLL